MKVLILGGSSYDEVIRLKQLPQPVSQTLFAPAVTMVGSTGVGKAVALKRLGFDVMLHTLEGQDDAGRAIRAYLEANQVPLITDPVPLSERHVNLVDETGRRISIFTQTTPDRPTLDTRQIAKWIEWSDLIVLNIIAYTKQLLELIRVSGKPVWTDLHDYEEGNAYYDPFIQASEAIFLSHDRLSDPAKIANQWLASGKRFVVVTMGNQGSELFEPNKPLVYEPILNRFPFVDPNGAGDSFFAGFLYGYATKKSLLEAMVYGTICGGMAVASEEIASVELTPAAIEETKRLNYEEVK
jgi:acarbose 7IV-phosphotransferase